MKKHNPNGREMLEWAGDLYPLHRSLTGEGVRQTLAYFRKLLPGLKLHEVPTGFEAFDWNVPKEWEISGAWIENEKGEKIVDLENHTLHVVGYSAPVDRWVSREELEEHLWSLPHLPDAIPYITSYYKETWGFCIRHRQREELTDERYRVVIKSRLFDGVMNYADLLIPGKGEKEIFFSTYICHPSMGNNELSGPVLSVALARFLMNKGDLKYNYRFIFVPETIGSIVYLQKHLEEMQLKTHAGFVLTCVGDDRTWSMMPSRYGNSVADRALRKILNRMGIRYKEYSFLERGSDERQYCSPGVDLPVASVMRSKYREYAEYHTSMDNLKLISEQGLQKSYNFYTELINYFEETPFPEVTVPCEPQLGKRGLYPSGSVQGVAREVRDLRNLIAYADGSLDPADLFEKAGLNADWGARMVEKLQQHGLISDCGIILKADGGTDK